MTAEPSSREDRSTYRRVLAHPTFRVLFGTRALATMSDTLRTVALSVLVFTLTGSALLGALAYGISFIPQVIGGSLFGALADRVPPRRLIAASYTIECGTALVLGLANLPVWANLAVVAGVACLTPVFNGASSRAVADVLSGDDYVLGRSLSNMASSMSQLIGLAGGGAAVGVLGAKNALLVSAALHLVAAAWVRLGLVNLPAPAGTGVRGTLRQSRQGNWELLTNPRVRVLILAQWLPPAFVTGAESLLVPYAGARGLPAGAAGLLLACLPVGMLAGNLAFGRFFQPALRERLLVPLIVALGVPLLFFAVNGIPLFLCAVLLVCTGTGFAYGLAVQRRFRDAVPETMRGQAFSLLATGLMTAQGISPPLAGAVAEILPVGVVIALTGLATVVTAAALRGRLAPAAHQR